MIIVQGFQDTKLFDLVEFFSGDVLKRQFICDTQEEENFPGSLLRLSGEQSSLKQ